MAQHIFAPIDESLKPVEEAKSAPKREVSEVLKGIWPGLKLLSRDVNQNAQRSHTCYFEYIYWCYIHHRTLVMSPDLLWFETLAQVAKDVASPASLRHYQQKFGIDPKKVIVYDPAIPGICDVDAMVKAAKELFPFDPLELFDPRFTTTTPTSREAIMSCFGDIVTSMVRCEGGCGFPAVRLLGTTEDWAQVARRASDLAKHFDRSSRLLLDGIAPIAEELSRLTRAKDIKAVGDFFRNFIHNTPEDCDSGSARRPHLSGWITTLYGFEAGSKIEPAKFPHLVSKVIFGGAPCEAYVALYGVFTSTDDVEGVPVPDFGRVSLVSHDEDAAKKLLSPLGKMGFKRALSDSDNLQVALEATCLTPSHGGA